MNKILKYSLISVGTVVGMTLALAAYVVVTFDPNDYKDQVIKVVKDSKQRTLRLDGDIKLSFFPNIGANVNKVSLSEFKSDKEFAAIESVRVSLALWPLLSKQVVVDEVTVRGLKATLVKHKDGTSNIDDLLEKDTRKKSEGQQVQFDIASVSVKNTNLTYLDEVAGVQYGIKDLNLETGRIAIGVPTRIDLSMHVQANQPKLDIDTQLKATLTFDLDKQHFQLQGMDMQVSGSALDISKLILKASGDVVANLTTQEFDAKKLTLNATGVKDKNSFEVILDAPSISLAAEKYAGEKLTLNAKLDGAIGNVTAVLTMPGVEGNAQSFKVSALTVDMEVKQPEQTFKVKLTSPFSGNLKTQQFDLSNLQVVVNATGDRLPNKSINSEMKGSVQIDAAKQVVQANLAGGLLQSQIRAKVGMKGFSDPAINFDVDVDQFDADLYMPKAPVATVPKSNQPEQPLDFSALRKLNMDGSLRIGSIKVANVKAAQLRMDVKAHNGLVSVSPLSANLYQGSMNGSLSVNAKAMPIITINQALTGVNVATLGRDVANFDTLEGKGNVGLNLTMQGDTVSAMKKTLDGNIKLNLVDGAVKGYNVAKKIRDAKAMFGKGDAQTHAASKEEQTDFSEMKATFKVSNGVAHNDDLTLKSPLIRVGGAGDINIGNESINYLAKATLVKSLEGQGGADSVGGITVPLRISGPFSNIKYKLDLAAMVSESAKQKIEVKTEELKEKVEVKKEELKEKVDTKKEEIKSRAEDQIKDKLKGLFR